jgi:signal transduction histidine kinase
MGLTAAYPHELLAAHDEEHLREQAMNNLLPFVGLLAWAAFIDATRAYQDSLWAIVTATLLIFSVALAALLRERRPVRCRGLLIGALTASFFSLVLTYPMGPSRPLGVLVMVACASLLSQKGGVVLGAGLCLGLLAIQWLAPDTRLSAIALAQQEAILLCGAVLVWASRLHFNTTLAWSSDSTARALALADKLQDRQLLLNRTLRAMEEATFRIERTNNELVLAQREAQIGRAAKSRFAATVSHEIRGPLNLILGFSRLLALSPERYGDELTGSYYADVDVIYRNAQHLCALVDDVLDLSRIEAEHLSLVREEIELARDVVAPTLASVRSLAEAKGLDVQENYAEMPPLLADPVRLKQAVLNLVLNAIRLTERGSVTVSTRMDGNMAVVTVADTGAGIAPERLADLFGEFSQLHAATQRARGGTGLGLSITKHLVEAHGGRIWAEAELGLGTTMSFAISLLPGQAQSEGFNRARAIERRTNEHDTCLVVHNDPIAVNMLARHLGAYRLVGLADTTRLEPLIEELRPRAIVADRRLAAEVEAVLARLPYDVPLFTCGLPSRDNLDPVSGILGYLTKPLGEDAVDALLRHLDGQAQHTILLVDDEPDATRLLEALMQGTTHPHRILKAYDGQQALGIMDKIVPDLVVIDWFMPEMNGEETITRMRANPRLLGVPVVIVSGRDWLEEGVLIGTPLEVNCRRPVRIERGAKYIEAVLDQLAPDYVSSLATG